MTFRYEKTRTCDEKTRICHVTYPGFPGPLVLIYRTSAKCRRDVVFCRPMSSPPQIRVVYIKLFLSTTLLLPLSYVFGSSQRGSRQHCFFFFSLSLALNKYFPPKINTRYRRGQQKHSTTAYTHTHVYTHRYMIYPWADGGGKALSFSFHRRAVTTTTKRNETKRNNSTFVTTLA